MITSSELKHQLTIYKKAIDSLQEALVADDGSDFLRDSIIQRFEYCINLARKTWKKFLIRKGVNDVKFPKDVIKTLDQYALIKEVEVWIDFIEYRNLLSHVYTSSGSIEVYEYIKENKQCFSILFQSLQKII